MLSEAEHFVYKELVACNLEGEIDKAKQAINCYLDCYYYKSKDLRLAEWNPDEGEIFEIALRAMTIALVNQRGTLQQYLGMLESNFPHDNTIDRVKTAGEVLAVIAKVTDFIRIEKPGRGAYIMVESGYEIDNIPVLTKHEIIYEPIKENKSNYTDFGSLILGHKVNHHDKDISLNHLNIMNKVPLALNRRFLQVCEETPQYVFQTLDQKTQWTRFNLESREKYIEVLNKGNKFYLHHKYDKRGRTYAQGYHITTQGSAFKKAVVELYHKELIPMETNK